MTGRVPQGSCSQTLAFVEGMPSLRYGGSTLSWEAVFVTPISPLGVRRARQSHDSQPSRSYKLAVQYVRWRPWMQCHQANSKGLDFERTRFAYRGRTVIFLIARAVTTSEMLEPGSDLTVVGINHCCSISVQHHRQIRYHIRQLHSK